MQKIKNQKKKKEKPKKKKEKKILKKNTKTKSQEKIKLQHKTFYREKYNILNNWSQTQLRNYLLWGECYQIKRKKFLEESEKVPIQLEITEN